MKHHGTAQDSGTIRAFVALLLAEEDRRIISEVQQPLRMTTAPVKWEMQKNFHITLRFLGDSDPSVLREIGRRFREELADFSPVSLRLDLIGCFPTIRNPRIVWLGCTEAPAEMIRLGGIAERIVREAGFEPESKAFHPHITLGRVKGAGGMRDLQNAIESRRFDPLAVRFESLSIMKSVLQPAGAVHTELERVVFQSTRQS